MWEMLVPLIGGVLGNALGGGGNKPAGGAGGGSNPLGAIGALLGGGGGAAPGGALPGLPGLDPNALVTTLSGQLLPQIGQVVQQATGMTPEIAGGMAQLQQLLATQANVLRQQQQTEAAGRAVVDQMGQSLNPQLDELRAAEEQRRNQIQATMEHRRIVADDAHRAAVMQKLALLERKMTRLHAAIDRGGPVRY